MSSAGLIWKYYGKEVLKSAARRIDAPEFKSEEHLNFAWQLLYDKFFLEVDAIDNGVNESEGGNKNYSVSTGLSSRVARLNSMDKQPEQFKKAQRIVEDEFLYNLYGTVVVFLPARTTVEEAWNKRKEINETGEFIYFEKTVPWKAHLIDLEKENSCEGLIKFAFYQDDRGMHRV